MAPPARCAGSALIALAALWTVTACSPATPQPSASSAVPAPPPSTSPSTSASTSTTPSGPPACTTGALAIDVVDAAGGGAAGSTYLNLEFTNRSDATCGLYGWPGVSLVGDDNGTQLGAAAARVDEGSRKPVELGPGAKTTALLRVVEAGNYDAGQCGPVTADGFRIYPPNQTAAAYVPRKTPACSKDGVSLLSISPVGTSG